MKKFLTILLLTSLTVPSFARDKFWTKKQIIGTTIAFALRSTDSAQTCYHFNEGGREIWTPMLQDCGKIVGWNLGANLLEIGTSYAFYKLKWHKAQDINPYAWALPSAAGIVYSYRSNYDNKITTKESQ